MVECAGEQGPVRVALPTGRRSRAPTRGVDPPHDAPARRARRRRARSGARCGTPRLGRRTPSSSRSRRPRAQRLERPRRGARAAPPRGSSSPRARSPACGTSRARGCTARRSRAPSSRARFRTPCSPAGSRPASAAPRSPGGAAWSATTGAPSTLSAGCGCTPSASHEAPGAWLDVALGRVRVGRVVTPWVGNGALALDGRRYRLGGLRRRVRVDARVGELEAVAPGVGVVVRVAVTAPAGQTVAFAVLRPRPAGATTR